MLTPIHIVAVAGGIVSHIGYFNRSEHHLYGSKYVLTYSTIYACCVIFSWRTAGTPIAEALRITWSIAGSYLLGLFTSLVIYRTCLHPLNKFPGPLGARISCLYFSLQLGKSNAHKKLLKLHETHGDFLRIGSSDLSVVHPKAVQAVHGPGSHCTKAPWYDLALSNVSMQATRHRVQHDRRRRIWTTAFSDKALRGYEERLRVYRQKLVSHVSKLEGQKVDMTKLFNLYSFDVMGDLAFGTSFKMLDTNEEHWAIKLLNKGIEPLGLMFPIWFFRLMVSIPGLARDWWRFINYCSSKLDERMNSKVQIPDIMSALLEPWKSKKPTAEELSMLQGDSQLIVVAGSDTTAATLTCIFYELARHPDEIEKLRDELSPYTRESGEFSHQDIYCLPHLNGVINEALRLYPPVPSGLQRLTPPEGLEIGDVHIPGNMTIYCPQYVLGRSENIYSQAASFIPERWYSKPDMVKEKSAFSPFSTGVYGCIGRPLALLNIRTTVARLVADFDVAFAPGDESKFFEERITDHFTLGLPPLNFTIRKRNASV